MIYIYTITRPQGLVTIFFIPRLLLKTTREESQMSNFHTTQNVFYSINYLHLIYDVSASFGYISTYLSICGNMTVL